MVCFVIIVFLKLTQIYEKIQLCNVLMIRTVYCDDKILSVTKKSLEYNRERYSNDDLICTCLVSPIPSDSSCIVVVLRIKIDRVHWHGVLHITEEEQSAHLPAYIPPLDHVLLVVDRNQICCRGLLWVGFVGSVLFGCGGVLWCGELLSEYVNASLLVWSISSTIEISHDVIHFV